MNLKISEAFCLKDGRKNFQVHFRTKPVDRQAYFGNFKLNDILVDTIVERYSMGKPPKKYVYGYYGAGKTHTLFNIKYQLEESEPRKTDEEIRCRIIEGEFRSKTNYSYLHEQMLESITLEEIKDAITEFLAKHASGNLTAKLKEVFLDTNIARAIQALGLGAQEITIWKWLCGNTLSNQELNALNLTKNMNTSGELLKVLFGICRLFTDKNIYYLFMLDEMEGLKSVSDSDAQDSFHDAFRRLADDENDVVGFIVSTFAGTEDEIAEFVYRSDITSRIGSANIHEIRYLTEEPDLKQFLLDLFSLTIDTEKVSELAAQGTISGVTETYPFTSDALTQFIDYAVSAPLSSLPRNIIDAVNECALEAARRDSRIIEVRDIEPAATIFQERL